MIQLKATGRLLSVESVEPLTTGSVGIPVELELSSDFDGLTAFLCFSADGVTAEYEVSDAMTVPPQCLKTNGVRLNAGVYAEDAEGTVVIPTVWATVGTVCKGTTISGAGPLDPAPTWVQDVIETSEETQAIAQSVRDDADAGVFDGERGPQGIAGNDGVSPVVIEVYNAELVIHCDTDGRVIPYTYSHDVYFTAWRGTERIPCTVERWSFSGNFNVSVTRQGTDVNFGILHLWVPAGEKPFDQLQPWGYISLTITAGGKQVTRNVYWTAANDGQQGIQGEIGPQGTRGPKGDTGSDAIAVTGPLPLLIPCDQYNYPVSVSASSLQASFFGAYRGDAQVPCRVSIEVMSSASPATTVTRGALTIRVGNQDSVNPLLYVTADPTRAMDVASSTFAIYIYPIVDGAYQPVEIRYFQCVRSNSGEGTSIFPTAIVMPHPSGSGYQRATISAWQHTYSSIAVGMSLSVKNLPSGMVEVERKDSTATKAATVLVQWPDDGTLAGGATSGNLTLTVTYPNLQSVDVTVPWMVM